MKQAKRQAGVIGTPIAMFPVEEADGRAVGHFVTPLTANDSRERPAELMGPNRLMRRFTMSVMETTQTHEKVQLGQSLVGMLADNFMVYNTTQAFHWNVEGPQFYSLHKLFEAHYTDMAEASDELAERVRKLGFFAPWNFSELQQAAKITQPGRITDADEMLDHLIGMHGQMIERANEVIRLSEPLNDQATLDLMVQRLHFHEKAVWMLRATLGRESATLNNH